MDADVIIRAISIPPPTKELAYCMEDIDRDFVAKGEAQGHHGRRQELRLRLLPRARPSRSKASGVFLRACIPFFTNAINIRSAHPRVRRRFSHFISARRVEVEMNFDTGVIRNLTNGKNYRNEPFRPLFRILSKRAGFNLAEEK